MASKTRDQRTIDAVPCPRCHACAGAPCWVQGVQHGHSTHGPQCHAERRAAWVEWKKANPERKP